MFMQDFIDYFNGKKVTVMRIGLLGRGVGDTAYMVEAGAEVLVVDDAPQEVMQPSVDALKDYENVTFKFGPYDEADFVDADMILVGAGAPLEMPVLAAARAAGVPLKQSAALFAELSKIPIIGVTGTRGKSTVTQMIHHVLSMVTGEQVLLGGNVRGVSNLQLLKEVTEDSLAVMELDSWQLQGWGWAEMSPQIAVFTNFMEDHLNYYMIGGKTKEEAMDAYFADKANIFKYQEESGVFITTPEVFEYAKNLASKASPRAALGLVPRDADVSQSSRLNLELLELAGEVVLVDDSIIPEDTLLSMPGEHNRMNAALAVAALRATGLTDEEIFEGLASFTGVSGRLEYLGEQDGVKIYNDNNSTTPTATIAGLKALGDSEKKNVVLIAGGAYKEVDPSVLIPAINEYCKKVILLPGSGTDLIVKNIDNLTTAINRSSEVVDSLEKAVAAGLAAGEPGDILLFSPGFASFGLFKNEYERNDAFVAAVQNHE